MRAHAVCRLEPRRRRGSRLADGVRARSPAAAGYRSCSAVSRPTGWSAVSPSISPTWGTRRSEFFLDGTASAYSPAPGSTLTSDGRWTVQPSSEAAYTTRVVVNRPVDRRDFNGTVVVEWLNVSGGADASPDWMHTHVELIRRGYAWVGVSAQAVGRQRPEGRRRRRATPCGTRR